MALLHEREFPAVADEDRPDLLSMLFALVLISQSFELLYHYHCHIFTYYRYSWIQ